MFSRIVLRGLQSLLFWVQFLIIKKNEIVQSYADQRFRNTSHGVVEPTARLAGANLSAFSAQNYYKAEPPDAKPQNPKPCTPNPEH